MNLENLVRPEILKLQAYSSARSEYVGSSQIQLDANESPWTPYGSRSPFNRYPEPQPKQLKQKLAEIYQVDEAKLLLTRGMDEGIDLLIRTFCRPGADSVVIIPPTFGYYKVAANINGVAIIETSLDKIDTGKIVFLCSPNNPTGELIDLDKIAQICQSFQGLVVVDEAYIEFSSQASATTLLAQYPNLVVTRTLSKAYGLAGIRLGAVIATEQIIAWLQKVIPPYPIAQVCADLALQALSPLGLCEVAHRVEIIKEQRSYVAKALSTCADVLEILPSEANFLLVIFKDAHASYQILKRQGVIVRNRSGEIPGALRLTIGLPEENAVLLHALGALKQVDKPIRQGFCTRKTQETEIVCDVLMDGQGRSEIETGIGFFDHMLQQLAKHSGISMRLKALGDLHIDAHHTIEDVAIVLGVALKDALKDKYGIARYGFVLPMDEAQTQVAIDLSGRAYLDFEANFPDRYIGEFPVEMVRHFFDSLSQNLGAAIHIRVTGKNTHHMIESCFKGVAKTLAQTITESKDAGLPSTKGVLA